MEESKGESNSKGVVEGDHQWKKQKFTRGGKANTWWTRRILHSNKQEEKKVRGVDFSRYNGNQ